jgi:hypothetical protein
MHSQFSGTINMQLITNIYIYIIGIVGSSPEMDKGFIITL